MNEKKKTEAGEISEAEVTKAPKSEIPDLPKAVEEFRKNEGKGFMVADPTGEGERYFFRNPNRSDLAYYVKILGLKNEPKTAMDVFVCNCVIHPTPEEMKERIKVNSALSSNFMDDMLKRLGGGRLFNWYEVEGLEEGYPDEVRKALEKELRIIRVVDFETGETFFFRRPGTMDQKSYLLMAANRQNPLGGMEGMCRDCALSPDGKALVERFRKEPALAMDLHDRLNNSIGGGLGMTAQDF